jgi:hypothetical protein
MPAEEILEGDKNRKNAKSKMKRLEKNRKEGKLKMAPSPLSLKIVAATSTALASNDPQQLTNHGILLHHHLPPSNPVRIPD